ncbi:MAG: alpha/beta hydrolase [Candidatus Cryptobacteroides sp.]
MKAIDSSALERREPQVSCGTLVNFDNFPSRFVAPRAVRVWLPDGWLQGGGHDVLYMHDGQMLFDSEFSWNGQEWGVDETLGELIGQGKVRPCIVVGIDNVSGLRIGEYCPDDMSRFLRRGERIFREYEPMGNAYLKFIVEELKPFIDRKFPTYTDRSHTWIAGSSCGGLISSYALCRYPEVFNGAACLSTHCTMSDPATDRKRPRFQRAYRRYMETCLPEPNSHMLYMDCGTETLDATYVQAQDELNRAIESLGWDSDHFMHRLYEGHSHCEDDWRSRLAVPLCFFLGK